MNTWLKLTMKTDPVLLESLSDFLIGVIGAGTDMAADEVDGCRMLTAYLDRENPTPGEVEKIRLRVESYSSEIAKIFKVTRPEMHWELFEEQDWSTNWKQFFRPFTVSDDLVIAPTWEEYAPSGNEKVIVMDPGMAFGTGHHPTTALVLQLLGLQAGTLSLPPRVLDVGTGTGVLAMAAALFGAGEVLAVDNDPVAVAAAAANIARNGLENRVHAGSTPIAEIEDVFDLVLANIVQEVLVEMAPDLARLTGVGGALVLSGLLAGEQVDSINDVFGGHGFMAREYLVQDGWAALLLHREDGE